MRRERTNRTPAVTGPKTRAPKVELAWSRRGTALPGTVPQNWLKICQPIKDGKRACILRQVVVTSNNQFLGSFLLRDDPGPGSRLLAVSAVPLGLLLPFVVLCHFDGG